MDARQYAPATQRNREPILEVLSKNLTPSSNVLELASGTGEHATFFASQCKSWYWIPSDVNPKSRESIIAWKNNQCLDNLALPLTIDVAQDNWYELIKEKKIDAIVNINMLHISPWNTCLGLFEGAKKILDPGGVVYLYGPFKRNGEHTSNSNAMFDRSLRGRNSTWGVRDLEMVVETAANANLKLKQVIKMPANNLSIIFIKLD